MPKSAAPHALTARHRPAGAAWRWAGAGALFGLLLALLVFAPAHWLATGVERATGGRVLLLDPRGTVWNGSAQLLLTGGADSRDAARLPGLLHWQLQPRLWGLGLSLYASCCTSAPMHLQLRPRWGGASLDLGDSQSSWPAQLLAGLGTPWNTVQPAGQLLLSSRGLRLDLIEGRLSMQGDARLDALELSSRLSTLRPLGSYRLTLQGGASTRLQLDTLSGSLQLRGEGQWIGSRVHFTGKAEAAPEREEALSNLLNIIGRREGAQSIITLG